MPEAGRASSAAGLTDAESPHDGRSNTVAWVSDDPAEILLREFRELSPEDRELVMALVARLRGVQVYEFPRDVPFMDFDE